MGGGAFGRVRCRPLQKKIKKLDSSPVTENMERIVRDCNARIENIMEYNKAF